MKDINKENIIEDNPSEINVSNDEVIIEELKIALEKLQKENEQLDYDKKRALADWDNARKQYEHERKEIIKYRSQSMILQILPILDNFERALEIKHVSEEVKNFVTGFQMMINQLKLALTNEGVKAININTGDEFNSHYHYAIEEVESDKYQPNQIVKVLQKGYMLYERVLRVATVQVAKTNSTMPVEENDEKEGK